jgi:hypothetical protein
MRNIKEQIESNKIGINTVIASVHEDVRADLRIVSTALAGHTLTGSHGWKDEQVALVIQMPYDADKVERAALNLATKLADLHHYVSEFKMLTALGRCPSDKP